MLKGKIISKEPFKVIVGNSEGFFHLEDIPPDCPIIPGAELEIHDVGLQNENSHLPLTEHVRIKAVACLSCKWRNLPLSEEGCPRTLRS